MKSHLCFFFALLASTGCFSDSPTIDAAEQHSFSTSPAIGWGDFGVVSSVSSDGSVTWCCTAWHTPLHAEVGSSVAALAVSVRDNGIINGAITNGNRIALILEARTRVSTALLGSVLSDGSGGDQILPITLTVPHVVADGEELVLKALAFTAAGPALLPSTIRLISANSSRGIEIRPFWPRMVFARGMTPALGADGSISVVSSATNALAFLEVPVAAGETLLAIDATVSSNGTTNGSIAVDYAAAPAANSGGGQKVHLAGLLDVGRTATWGNAHVDVAPQVIAPDGYLVVSIFAASPGYRWGEMHATVARR